MPRPVSKLDRPAVNASDGHKDSAADLLSHDATRQLRRTAQPARAGVTLDGARLLVLLLMTGLALQTRQAVAVEAVQTFGPGQVNCQVLTGTQVDCLLAASRVTEGNRNVATFGVTALPRGQQALFRKWCLAVANECTVTVTGRRASPQSSRLSTVTAVHWTRLSPPANESAARVAAKASATEPAVRPAP